MARMKTFIDRARERRKTKIKIGDRVRHKSDRHLFGTVTYIHQGCKMGRKNWITLIDVVWDGKPKFVPLYRKCEARGNKGYLPEDLVKEERV